MIHLRLSRLNRFISNAIEAWSLECLAPGCVMFSDGLACFRVSVEGVRRAPIPQLPQWVSAFSR